MTHTFEELKHKTVGELREIAAGLQHEAVKGYTQMNKEHLLPALAKALGIAGHEHHVVGEFDKTAAKARIRELKKKRDQALAAHDHVLLHEVRREIHHLKHQINRATV